MNRTPASSCPCRPRASLIGALLLALMMSVGVWPAHGQGASEDELTCEPLCLGHAPPTFDQRVSERLDLMAPPGPMEDWPPGLTIPQRTGPLLSLSDPWDLVLQYRVPLEYCSGFWPEHEPDKTVGQLCREDLLTNWRLVQGLYGNPFVLADNELHRLDRSGAARRNKALWMAAYAYAHRGEASLAEGLADVLLTRDRYAQTDALVSLLAPPLVRLLPRTLTKVVTGEGEQSVDMRVTTEFSYDSVATNEQALRAGAARGLQAVAIAGRGQLGDARAAERLAESLRARGQLPPDFRVIPGEYIESRNGPVLGVFLEDSVPEGQTLTATVADIHHQGGLAYLARPGIIGAAVALRELPFDGFLFGMGNFELFRSLMLLNDPRYADRPGLYASNTAVGCLTGLPYSNVRLVAEARDPLRAGLAARQGYAAGTLYLPWMLALAVSPVAVYQRTLNQFFVLNDRLALFLCRVLGANHVVIRTSWDDAVRDLISLSRAVPACDALWDGSSPLRDWPDVNYIEAEYGRVGVGYDRVHKRAEVHCRWSW